MGSTTIRIDAELKHQLEIKSSEMKIKQAQLLNQLVKEGLERIEQNKDKLSDDEIKELLEHDRAKPINLDNIIGIVETAEPTDSVQLKKETYRSVNPKWFF